MKRIVVLLCINLFALASLVSAQVEKVQSLSSNAIPLEQALKQLETKFNIHFAYDPNLVSKYHTNLVNTSLDVHSAIKQCLKSTIFDAIIQDKQHIVLTVDNQKFKQLHAPKQQGNPYYFSGNVSDVNDKQILIGASVILFPDGVGITTDETGNFVLQGNSYADSLWLEIRYVGYEIKRIRAAQTEMKNINIVLHQGMSSLQAVTIVSQRQRISLSPIATRINIYQQDIPNVMIANVGRDVMHALKMKSGVNATDDFSSSLEIRGNGIENNLVLLDNMPIYNLDHFNGMFSNLNPYLLSSIDLYKSYFPVQYGGRTSSVIDIHTKTQTKNWHGGVEANLLQSNVYVQAPLHQSVHLMGGLRFTNQNIGDSDAFNVFSQNQKTNSTTILDRTKIRVVTVEPHFNFYDAYAKLQVKLTNALSIRSSYFISEDKQDAGYQVNYLTPIQGSREFKLVLERFNERINWKNQAFNVHADYAWNKHLTSQVQFSNSNYTYNQQANGAYISKINGQSRSDTLRSSSNTLNTLESNTLRFDNHVKLDSVDIHVGLEWNAYQNTVNGRIDGYRGFRDSLVTGNETALYLDIHKRFLKSFFLNVGLRISHFDYIPTSNLSPRASIQYHWSKHASTGLRWGYYHQYLRQASFEDRYGRVTELWQLADDNRFPIAMSNQSEIINSFNVGNWTTTVELYYKKIQGIIIHTFETPAQLITGTILRELKPIILKGDEKTYGLDVSIGLNLKQYKAAINYSYTNSLQSFPNVNQGAYFPKQYVRDHQIKIPQSYTFKNITCTLNSIYGSGYPYIDLYLIPGNIDRTGVKVEENVSYLKDYYRFDLDAQYKLSLKKGHLIFGASIFNMFDRANVKSVQYLFTLNTKDPTTNKVTDTRSVSAELNQLPRTWNLAISYHF